MPFNEEGMLDNNQAAQMLKSMVDSGRAGLFSWNLDNDTVQVMETITGREFKNIKNLEDFIRQFVFAKDLEMALQDVNQFMTSDEPNYQSTFRVLDFDKKVRWIFCKGTMRDGNKMSAIMYDVTEGNLMQGHDLTTNLMNGTTFMRKLKNTIHRKKCDKLNSALIHVSIDNYHIILNKYGFDFSEPILYKVSRVLLGFVGDKDELASFPNKFMMLLDRPEDVEQLAQDIRNIFEEPFYVNNQPFHLKINIGITLFPEASSDADELMRISEFALNHSRKSGNQTVTLFDSKLMTFYNRELNIEDELPGAIPNQELYLMFQPQINIKTNKISGIEVLARWKNKNLGFVSPEDFIPVAENKGYIVPIGRWIRNESLKTARKWLDKGLNFDKIALNISTIEILQKDFKERLLGLCDRYEIKPKMIELEVTERTFANTDGENIIADLLNEGFRIALDDFGTGYSNLRSLIDFDIYTLKLDKSLIDKVKDQRLQYIVQGILLAKNYLYHELIAEGVEDEETLTILSDLGFENIQGYYFSKPLSKSDMEKFILDFNGAKM